MRSRVETEKNRWTNDEKNKKEGVKNRETEEEIRKKKARKK